MSGFRLPPPLLMLEVWGSVVEDRTRLPAAEEAAEADTEGVVPRLPCSARLTASRTRLKSARWRGASGRGNWKGCGGGGREDGGSN